MEVDTNNLPSLKIGTFNANGLGDKTKRREVINWLKGKGNDLILLQETHSTEFSEPGWISELGKNVYFNNGSSNALGTAFLIMNRNLKVIRHKIIEGGRLSFLEVEYENIPYCIVNVYAPNNDNVDLLEKMASEVFGRQRDDFLILGGDWNTVLNNSLDKVGGSLAHGNKKCQSFLNSLMAEVGLFDPFRLEYPTDKKFTHFNKKCKTGTRLDFFLVDNNVINLPVCSSSVTHGFRSDHSYVELSLQGNKIDRGRGYWKLNNSLLEIPEFCDDVCRTIDSTLGSDFDSWGGAWDVIKFKIKDVAILYGKKRKNEFREKKSRLEEKISKLQNKLTRSAGDSNSLVMTELQESRQQLDNLTRSEIQGIITRARLQWVEEGERSTRYFLGLEKSSAKKKALTNLVSDSGEILTTQSGISRHVVAFYQSLFSSRDPHKTDIKTYLEGSNLDRIDSETKEFLDRPISIEELTGVVGALKGNKSPGWDGLTSEFYKKFWDKIKSTLMKVLEESYEKMKLPPSMRIGVITLIPKPKPPPELKSLKNWRPITLLNTDYKIFTHVIKNRLMQTLPDLISNAQSGFRPGRSTSDNLIMMYLVLEYFNNNPEEEGIIMQIDYEKAFDSIEHEYLYETLKEMGFGERIINLVKIAFTDCISYANVNGHLSDPIYLRRGVHQGSPLSPVLFLFIAQTFTKNVERNENIVGLTIEGVEILQSLFADDTDQFLKASPLVISEVFRELDRFGDVSGCRCNKSKTKCILLGSARYRESLKADLRESYGQGFVPDEGVFSALGVQFTNSNTEDLITLNYNAKISKLEGIIKLWSRRSLTLFGRLTLIKTLLISQIVYLIVPLPRPPQQIVNKINKILHQFIWNCGTEKLSRMLVEKPKSIGGLDMINFDKFYTSLKLKSIGKILNDTFRHPWKSITVAQLKYPEYKLLCIEGNLAKPGCKFAKDLIQCSRHWIETTAKVNVKTYDEIVWGNRRVSGRQNHLWSYYLINQGILHLSQFTESGVVLSYERLVSKHQLDPALFSKIDYLPIKTAIRYFDTPSDPLKSLNNVDPKSSLSAILKISPLRHNQSKVIRSSMISFEDFPPKQVCAWEAVLSEHSPGNETDWGRTFNFLYGSVKNFKLIQHQYKLLLRIATSGYMRHKMKISPSPECYQCGSSPNPTYSIETLEHIYLKCPISIKFRQEMANWIREELDPSFSENSNPHITLLNDSRTIRQILIISNWYTNSAYQNRKSLNWSEFRSTTEYYLSLESH